MITRANSPSFTLIEKRGMMSITTAYGTAAWRPPGQGVERRSPGGVFIVREVIGMAVVDPREMTFTRIVNRVTLAAQPQSVGGVSRRVSASRDVRPAAFLL